MRTRFAPIVREIVARVWGQEPVGIATARVLSYYRAQQLGPGNGRPHYGMRGDPALTWMGWTQSPQLFQGQAQIGAVRAGGAPVDPAQAFPNAKAPPGLPGWLDQYELLQNIGS